MPRFFIRDPEEQLQDGLLTLTGSDASHIARSLRMKIGEALTASDFFGWEYQGKIVGVSPEAVVLRVEEKRRCESEPRLRVRVFQALPKGDKFDTVVQKATELGAYDFTPVLAARCVSRPDEKAAAKKRERWQKIAEEAAKQSGRGRIPAVRALCSFEQALDDMAACDLAILCYEGEETRSLRRCLEERSESLSDGATVAVYVGPEGGIEPKEAREATERGICAVSFGRRILRTETAPLFALSAILFFSGDMEP